MKTIKLLSLLLWLVGTTSCVSSYYRVATHIAPDGLVERTVYALGDSAFMAGNVAHNPFLFLPDASWVVTRLDSSLNYNFFGDNQKLNVKASRQFYLGSEASKEAVAKEVMRPLAMPREALNKRFRWFYTYYTFTGTYSEITDKGPVSIDKYLNEEEQKLWFRGDMSSYQGMNGVELNEVLGRVEKKFWQWYYRTLYELSFDVVQHYDSLSGNRTYSSRLVAMRDSLYRMGETKGDDQEFSPEIVCRLLDNQLATTYYVELYQKNEAGFTALFEEKGKTTALFETLIQYELTMPGRLMTANTSLREGDALVWRVDAPRLFVGEYTLTAESRVANTWAFVLTLLLLLVSIYCFWRLFKRR